MDADRVFGQFEPFRSGSRWLSPAEQYRAGQYRIVYQQPVVYQQPIVYQQPALKSITRAEWQWVCEQFANEGVELIQDFARNVRADDDVRPVSASWNNLELKKRLAAHMAAILLSEVVVKPPA